MDEKDLHVSIAVLTKTTSDLVSRLQKHEDKTDSAIESTRKECFAAIESSRREHTEGLSTLEKRITENMTNQIGNMSSAFSGKIDSISDLMTLQTKSIERIAETVSELKTKTDQADGAWYTTQVTAALFVKFLTVCTALLGGGYFLFHNLMKIL